MPRFTFRHAWWWCRSSANEPWNTAYPHSFKDMDCRCPLIHLYCLQGINLFQLKSLDEKPYSTTSTASSCTVRFSSSSDEKHVPSGHFWCPATEPYKGMQSFRTWKMWPERVRSSIPPTENMRLSTNRQNPLSMFKIVMWPRAIMSWFNSDPTFCQIQEHPDTWKERLSQLTWSTSYNQWQCGNGRQIKGSNFLITQCWRSLHHYFKVSQGLSAYEVDAPSEDCQIKFHLVRNTSPWSTMPSSISASLSICPFHGVIESAEQPRIKCLEFVILTCSPMKFPMQWYLHGLHTQNCCNPARISHFADLFRLTICTSDQSVRANDLNKGCLDLCCLSWSSQDCRLIWQTFRWIDVAVLDNWFTSDFHHGHSTCNL